MSLLTNSIRDHIPLTTRHYRARLLLLGPDTKSVFAGLIAKGLGRQYYFDGEGREIVTGFFRKEEVMLQTENFFMEVEAGEYLELLEDSELELFMLTDVVTADTKNDLLKIRERTIRVYRLRSQINQEIRKLNVREALHYMELLYPLNRISRKDIASYLRKAPESISRSRRHR